MFTLICTKAILRNHWPIIHRNTTKKHIYKGLNLKKKRLEPRSTEAEKKRTQLHDIKL